MIKSLFKRKKENAKESEEAFPIPTREAEVKQFLTYMENWKLDEIRMHVLNKHPTHKPTEHSIIAVMHRINFLRAPQKGFPNGRRELEPTDLEQRVKKVFAIIKLIIEQTEHIRVLDEVDLFLKIYEEEINTLDEKYSWNIMAEFSKASELKRLKIDAKNDISCKMDRCNLDQNPNQLP